MLALEHQYQRSSARDRRKVFFTAMYFGLALERQKSETVDLLINALALERQKQRSSASHALALKTAQ
jgi:hypothetical protein